MDPTLMFANDDGALRYVLGSPGGAAIILYDLKAIVALIDWRLDARRQRAGQFRLDRDAVVIEPGAEWNNLANALESLGS